MASDEPVPGPPAAGRVRPVDLRDYVDFDAGDARCVRVLSTARVALDLWCVEPQQATPVLRYDDRDVTYTVIGGRSWFVTDQGEIGLDPMGAMLVPAGVVHGIDNRGADPLIVVAAGGPAGAGDDDPPVARTGVAVRDDQAQGSLRRAVAALLHGGR